MDATIKKKAFKITESSLLLSLSINFLNYLLGSDWVEENLNKNTVLHLNKISNKYFKLDNLDKEGQKYSDRVTMLAETLFNLHNIDGFIKRYLVFRF